MKDEDNQHFCFTKGILDKLFLEALDGWVLDGVRCAAVFAGFEKVFPAGLFGNLRKADFQTGIF